MAKFGTLFVLFFGLLITSGFSQDKAATTENNLYAKALSACLVKEPQAENSVEVERSVIVEYNLFTTRNLPTQFGKIKVGYLDTNTLAARYKKNRELISILAIRPLQSDSTELELNILFYYLSFEKRSYNYSLEGGCNVKFVYDCEKKQFVVKTAETSGI